MKKSWKFTICMILFLLLPTACSPAKEEPDNPYRNTSESYGGSWMEALYEMHKGITELETGKIIFAFCAKPKEDFSHSFPFNRQVILPYFLEAETEPALLKIQQYYSEQNWTLSQEEMESYENYIKSDDIFGVNEYNLWRVYRQERFITVVFDSFSTWGRGRSDPYADVFWAETGEHVTFADLFKGKEAELLQALVGNGRQIPLGCVLEEWESWEFLFDDEIYARTLPSMIDSSFYPTPLGMVFSYSTSEIGSRAEGTILVFLDWASLEGICKLPDN